MLPALYELPAAIALVAGGAIACFAGHRLFRIVLAIYGFIAGAMLASSVMAGSNTAGMVVAALVGGVLGSLLLFFAYFVGIALVGAGFGAAVAHLGWTRLYAVDPPTLVVIILAALGTVGSLILQRYVIIVSTAFSGAWTMIVGVLALGDSGPTRGRSISDAWIFYPFTAAPNRRGIVIAWIVLGLIGTAVQLGVTGRKRR